MAAAAAAAVALARSHIALRSFGHSMSVTRRDLPVTTVTGPCVSLRFCLVQCLTSERITVDFPTPAGPTTATTMGGCTATSTARSVSATWYCRSCFSSARCAERCMAFGPDAALKARGLLRALPLPREAVRAAAPFLALAPLVGIFLAMARRPRRGSEAATPQRKQGCPRAATTSLPWPCFLFYYREPGFSSPCRPPIPPLLVCFLSFFYWARDWRALALTQVLHHQKENSQWRAKRESHMGSDPTTATVGII